MACGTAIPGSDVTDWLRNPVHPAHRRTARSRPRDVQSDNDIAVGPPAQKARFDVRRKTPQQVHSAGRPDLAVTFGPMVGEHREGTP
jgi:hypothetical protein